MLGRILKDVFRSFVSSRSGGQADAPNPLAEYFFNNPGLPILKWEHYLEIYHRHFAVFRGRAPVVLEIGVLNGGSLQMWRRYFGPQSLIVGVDVNPRCLQFQSEGIAVMIGDQSDRRFLAEIRAKLPRIDIIIDDGGHTMTGQIATFEELYPHLRQDGVYLCEDLHSSLFPEYGGGYGRRDTFLEYSKALVDRLHAWHSRDPSQLAVDYITRNTFALHFYDSVFVAEKRAISQPVSTQTGKLP